MTRSTTGFREIEHTADWELEVWGPNQEALFEQAALGMCSLLGLRLEEGPRERRTFELEAPDQESLLVNFLNELLFLAENGGFGPDRLDLKVRGGCLTATLEGAPIAEQRKEIKAATYSNLVIRETGRGLETRVVFDV